jgi:hypothetical protein
LEEALHRRGGGTAGASPPSPDSNSQQEPS